MTTTLHVTPIGDLVEHTSDDDCLREPTAEPVKAADGSVDWLMIHHGLDGRELAGNDHW